MRGGEGMTKCCEWCGGRYHASMEYPINPIIGGYKMMTICRMCVIECLQRKMKVGFDKDNLRV